MRIAAALIAALALAACDQADGRSFNSEAWRNQTDERPVRTAMVDDLLHSRVLTGKSRDEVAALLGEPTTTDKWSDWDLVYWLGPERGFMSIDSEWLVLRFADDRVVESRLVRD